MTSKWYSAAWKMQRYGGFLVWFRLVLSAAVLVAGFLIHQVALVLAGSVMIVLHIATYAIAGLEKTSFRGKKKVKQAGYEAINLSMHLLVTTIAALLGFATLFDETLGDINRWIAIAGFSGIIAGVWGVILISEPYDQEGDRIMVKRLSWKIARFLWWIELFVLLLLLGSFLTVACSSNGTATVEMPSQEAPPRSFISVEFLQAVDIAEFDPQAIEYIVDYVDAVPDEGPLNASTKETLTELLLLDAFEASVFTQAPSLTWDLATSIQVNSDHARQAISLAPSGVTETGPFCDEARSFERGKLSREYIFFFASDYSKFERSDLTLDDIAANPYAVARTLYSPFLDNSQLVEAMGLNTPAIPLQTLAWKLKVDIVAGNSASELIQWFETSGFRNNLEGWAEASEP